MTILDYFALVIIAAGWAIQLSTVTKKNTSINPSFLVLYIIGVLIIVASGLYNGFVSGALLNLVSATIAAALLYRINR